MKRSPLVRKTPLKRTAFCRIAPDVDKLSVPVKRRMKSRQRAVTAEEKALWTRLAALGCIACRKVGVLQPVVSIHHIDGRTKPGCHKLVLPLCAGHHQDGTGEDKSLIAVHPYKARFEAQYGTQMDLLAECMNLLAKE